MKEEEAKQKETSSQDCRKARIGGSGMDEGKQ
jgi:hypothetical protein